MRILLTHTRSARANYYGDAALSALRALVDVRLHEGDEPLTTEDLIARAQGCDAIVSDRQTPGEAGLFESLPGLVAFLRCAVDIRTVDLGAASRSGVLVTRATPGFVDAVAELALGFMIDLSRGVSRSAASYWSGEAPRIAMGLQLSSATMGIIGFGAIGRRVGALGAALGMTVLASDPRPIDVSGIEQVALAELLERSDFVICLAPANPATEKLMNAETFAAMRAGAYFINLARGELVDEDALAAALDSGRLAGAALDVGRAPDQMPSPSLSHRPDVIATPHIGGLTSQAVRHQAFDTVGQVAALVEGRIPPGAVNIEHAARFAQVMRGMR